MNVNNMSIEELLRHYAMTRRLATTKDIIRETKIKIGYTQTEDETFGNIYFKDLGGNVMSYWGRLCGSLFGTITYANLNDNGTVTIKTNHMNEARDDWFSSVIKKDIVDKLKG